jgi:hypothetical protein
MDDVKRDEVMKGDANIDKSGVCRRSAGHYGKKPYECRTVSYL